ncbi:MAG: flippase [Lachnospiraceae bacterium]|nr:flippase [Lachnospiraceae bacterium]
MASQNRSIRKNYIFNLLYKIVTVFTPLITAPYIARVFGPTGVGEYSYTYSIAQYFYSFAMLGISDYGSRTIAQVRDDKNKLNQVFSEIFVMQILTTSITSLLYVLYIVFFSESKLLSILQGFQILSVFIDFSWLFFGIENFKLISIRNIIIKLSSVLLIIVFVKSIQDIWLYTFIISGATVISQIFILPALIKTVKFILPAKRRVLQHMKPNVILFLPVISASILNYFDKIMLGGMSTKTELGYYDSAEKIIQVPNSMVTALGVVILPAITNKVTNKKENELKKLHKDTFIFISFAVCALSFGISGVAKEFVPIFFGKGYDSVVYLLYILVPSMVFISLANVMKNQYLLPFGKDGIFARCLIMGILINIILNTFLIPSYGAFGASFATTVSEFTILFSELICLHKKIELSEMLKVLCSFIVIGILMFIPIYLIDIENNFISLSVKIALGASIYLSLSAIWCYLFHRDILSMIFKRRKS